MNNIIVNKITFIGSGNVATNLAESFKKKGFSILEVWSKSIESSNEFSKKFNCKNVRHINKISNTDLIIVSVKDSFMIESINKVVNKSIPILHTSGSLDINILKEFKYYGVLYPLQTLKKESLINLENTPFLIEYNNNLFKDFLLELCDKISNKIHVISSEQRKIIHLSAVFSCNFTNHMFTIADEILKRSDVKFEILIPLIEKTLYNIKNSSPKKLQTGPAKRKDVNIIQDHSSLLEYNKDIQKIYNILSSHIMKTHS
tara:strand:+ start:14012 stop:14788 length:777 start_codon:yes stop_codon:yes gene_type:complete